MLVAQSSSISDGGDKPICPIFCKEITQDKVVVFLFGERHCLLLRRHLFGYPPYFYCSKEILRDLLDRNADGNHHRRMHRRAP